MTTGERLARLPVRLRVQLPGRRGWLILVLLLVLLGGAWLWLRDSSLVSVRHVTIQGDDGPEARQIRQALTSSARTMTTLHVQTDELKTAVAPFPVVKDLRVNTQFPHGLRIQVIEQIPVGAVAVGGRTIAVAGDGTLLHDVPATGALPSIPVRVTPGGSRLTADDGLPQASVLAAAPSGMLSRISQVTTVATHGLVVQLRSGPSIYFGDGSELGAKWTAATAVLADSGSAGAAYIDVTDPRRPAAGAGAANSSSGTGSNASGGG